MQFIDQQKEAKKVAAGLNYFSIQDSAEYKIRFIICRSDLNNLQTRQKS